MQREHVAGTNHTFSTYHFIVKASYLVLILDRVTQSGFELPQAVFKELYPILSRESEQKHATECVGHNASKHKVSERQNLIALDVQDRAFELGTRLMICDDSSSIEISYILPRAPTH
jgi:hypothetical protein